MPTTAHTRIESIMQTNEGTALIPILKRFEHLDPISYQAIGIALFDACKVGIESVEKLLPKGPTTEELLKRGKK